ncbi:acetate--CoA ligase family protein [Thauera sp. SDU_THAU2]|uniref:acetate--CoA ligase family protein n=1 Tax=Thauera sp. SDU_THAU2 TaxID=3136633 RepID=UPI004054CF7D
MGYPVVVKTAEAIAHKTEAGGVLLDIREPKALEAAYADLAACASALRCSSLRWSRGRWNWRWAPSSIRSQARWSWSRPAASWPSAWRTGNSRSPPSARTRRSTC